MYHTNIWVWFIRILFGISFFVGVSYGRKGKYLVLDGLVFCLSILWFGGCTIRLETDGLVFGSAHNSTRLCIMFVSLFTVNLVLFLTLIDFRLKSDLSAELIPLHRKLRLIYRRLRGRRTDRRLLNVFGVMLFQLLCGALFFYREETASDVADKVYDKLCATTLTWPTTLLCFQFFYWVQIFTVNVELVLERISCTITSANRTNAIWLSCYTLSKLKNDLRMVMRMKRAITDSYGSSIIFNQLYTFICLLLNFTLWTTTLGRIQGNQLGWYRYYFMARIIYYSALSYIPHWICQIAFSEVKELLYAIRKLLIRGHNTMFDEKVSNLFFNPVYLDLKFRVCDLFDLTNKQFISFLSISLGYAVIQMQFFVL